MNSRDHGHLAAPRSGLFSIRTALLLGFGGLLLLLIVSGLDAVQVISQMRHSNETIRREYLERARKVEQIRSALYLSGTYIRDYLLEPDPGAADRNRAALQATHVKIDSELATYESLLRPEQRGTFKVLQTQVNDYWDSLDPVLAWDSAHRRAKGYAFLRDEVFPRRTSMLNIADRIAAVNEEELTAGDLRLSQMFEGFRNRIVLVLAITVCLGLLQAAASMSRILRLERATARHLKDATEAQAQLRDLSAKLVEAQENERKAISRELHDAIGQALSAVLLELRNLSSILPMEPPSLAAHVQTTRRLVESTVAMVRNMALLLRPSMLDDLGLLPALEWQARDVSKRTGMKVQVTSRDVPEHLPDEHKTCIYRIVQEALNNVTRHAAAESVAIDVSGLKRGVELSIRDDGKGFSALDHKGLGLVGIQERAENLGGTFHVESEPGRGALLTVTLPWGDNAVQKGNAA
jgi:signal transduction histidine kinase